MAILLELDLGVAQRPDGGRCIESPIGVEQLVVTRTRLLEAQAAVAPPLEDLVRKLWGFDAKVLRAGDGLMDDVKHLVHAANDQCCER
jgi:hypothetical protein